MALRYSFGMGKEADMVDAAISGALARGLRTSDIAAKGEKTVSTAEMGQAIAEEIEKLAA
jgi:3-isopropylmalate dehydrogenase